MNIRSKSIACLIAVAVMLFTSVPVSAAGDPMDYVPIDINGDYDDWEDKPHTRIQWGPGDNYYLGALFRDANYVYLHIRVSQNGILQFNGSDYAFTADDNGSDNPDLVAAIVTPEPIVEGNNVLEIRRQKGYNLITGANGYVTRVTDEPDEWELCIPLSFFSSHPERIRTITFSSSNLGPQVLISTGTPTWPYLVAGTGVALAFAGFMLSKRKHAK